MEAVHLSRTKVWVSFQSTIMRTFSYALPALNVSKANYDAIMSILLHFVLPRLGICRHFPRSLVYAPKEFFGLGIRHLYTTQEIERLWDVITHNFRGSITGELFRASWELLHLELGSCASLTQWSFIKFGSLNTDSLAKCTWEFLDEHNLRLVTDLGLKAHGVGDKVLMECLP